MSAYPCLGIVSITSPAGSRLIDHEQRRVKYIVKSNTSSMAANTDLRWDIVEESLRSSPDP
jgi:hypothetical protein